MPHRPPIDILPLKDAARGLRAAAKRGVAALQDTLPLADLPAPAAALADKALEQARVVGQLADRSLSDLAHSLLDDRGAVHLDDMEHQAETRFAGMLYAALRQVLPRLGADPAGISETAARAAWRKVQAEGAASDAAVAARLLLALEEVKLVHPAQPGADLPLRPALFAVLLAMLAQPDAPTPLLPAAADLALALGPDLADAGGADALAALFEKFRHHV
ncbi:MAG: hypothetical protein Q8S53_14275 [Brevundimonas sp.]|uniref:hypothetical protein n=1 Tax=Brevundimonas sp. TaxID=1871086 RepID=UPI0027327CFE|nr:hypothetical protein [Brevundimonas sp.]MDP3379528.1 hypothetical protein [Brevundimonas sp.]